MPYGRRKASTSRRTSARRTGRSFVARRRSGGARRSSRSTTRRVSRARNSGSARTIRLVIQQAPAPAASADPVEALAAAKKVTDQKKRAQF